MLFLNFKSWRESELEHMGNENPLVECPYCKGSDEWVVDCGECDNGEIEFSELNTHQLGSFFTKKEYLKVIKFEFSKLASFTGKDESRLFFDNGFAAYCQIKSREVFIRE